MPDAPTATRTQSILLFTQVCPLGIPVIAYDCRIERQQRLHSARAFLQDGLLEVVIQACVPGSPRRGVILAELVPVVLTDEWMGVQGVGGVRVWWRQQAGAA